MKKLFVTLVLLAFGWMALAQNTSDGSGMQYLVFQITPADATLMVNDKPWPVEPDGSAQGYVRFGTYSYRAEAANYHPYEGTVTVDNPYETQIVTVELRPNMAEVTLSVIGGADIYVDGEYKGSGSWTGQLGGGTHQMECKKPGHENSVTTKEITESMSGQTITLPAPIPLYASLNVESNPNFSTIYLDGEEMGTTPRSIKEVLVGQHVLRLTKEGYDDYTVRITLAQGESKQVLALMRRVGETPRMADIDETDTSSSSGSGASNSSDEETFTVRGVTFTMKLVEGGRFTMGATPEQGESAEPEEKPAHDVTVSSFYMGETEVTQALWQAVMGWEPIINDGWTEERGRGDDYPAYWVSRVDIAGFLGRLSRLTGKNFRLPTEAEWEYAARGGRKSRGYKFAGDDPGWNNENSDYMAHPVKELTPNELGLYDMSGNLWEWVQDFFGEFSGEPQIDPHGPAFGLKYVIKGGSYTGDKVFCRVSRRGTVDLDECSRYGGFRLCLTK